MRFVSWVCLGIKAGVHLVLKDTLSNGTGKRLVWGSNQIGTGAGKRDGGEGGGKKRIR